MANPAVSFSQIWDQTFCARCEKPIGKGEPRVVIMLAELGVGPGFREELRLEDDEEVVPFDPGADLESDDDDDSGPRAYVALALCRPCSGEDPTIALSNPWFEQRAETCNSSGRSVRAILASNLKLPHEDFDSDPLPESGGEYQTTGYQRQDTPTRSAARNEAEDSFLSKRADDPIQPPLTQDDLRYRMQRFLMTPQASKLRHSTRSVLKLWADGKLQNEIAAETSISQATVSRIIRDGKSSLYSRVSKN